MSKHTPGPWIASKSGCGIVRAGEVLIAIAYDGQRPHEREVSGTNKQIEDANAYLIAAAPELLQALRDILAYSGIDPDADTRMGLREVNAARAAIAKAEGRS